MRSFARRLVTNLQQLGFADDQVEVVVRAIFHPVPAEADEATRQAWLLLGGADIAVAQSLTPAELAEVREEYELRRREGRRWREQERQRCVVERPRSEQARAGSRSEAGQATAVI